MINLYFFVIADQNLDATYTKDVSVRSQRISRCAYVDLTFCAKSNKATYRVAQSHAKLI